MSQEQNVELVERMYEAAARQDEVAVLECFHPNVELVIGRNLMEGGSYRGLDGIKRARADVLETWEDYSYEHQDIRATDDLVVSLGRSVAVGRGKAPVVEAQEAWVFKIHQGKIIKGQVYMSHTEALRAVGLEG